MTLKCRNPSSSLKITSKLIQTTTLIGFLIRVARLFKEWSFKHFVFGRFSLLHRFMSFQINQNSQNSIWLSRMSSYWTSICFITNHLHSRFSICVKQAALSSNSFLVSVLNLANGYELRSLVTTCTLADLTNIQLCSKASINSGKCGI